MGKHNVRCSKYWTIKIQIPNFWCQNIYENVIACRHRPGERFLWEEEEVLVINFHVCHAMILDGDGRWWDNLSLRSIAKIRPDLTACHNIAMASMYMIIGTCMQRGVK